VACTHVGSLSKFTPRYFVVYLKHGYYNVICGQKSCLSAHDGRDVMVWFIFINVFFFFSIFTYTARFYIHRSEREWRLYRKLSADSHEKVECIYIYIYSFSVGILFSDCVYTVMSGGRDGLIRILKVKIYNIK